MRAHARTKGAARQRYVGPLQRSLSCLSRTAVWRMGPLRRGPEGRLGLFLSRVPLELKRNGRAPLYIEATQHFHEEADRRRKGEWKVRTDAYLYQITLSEISPTSCCSGTGTPI